jgi:hypothetical protein
MTVDAVVQGARRGAKRAGNSEWLDRAARAGFAARGVLYLTVAFLAASIALGRAGEPADKQGAVQTLADTPLGTFLLVLLVGGLTGLGLWQAAEALWGRTSERNDGKRAAKRAASAGKAVLYLALAASAASVLLQGDGSQAGGGEQETKESNWTARVLELPAGRVLVILAGLALLGAGGWLVARGVQRKFEKHLKTGVMSPSLRRASSVVGLLGHVARGVVAGLAGLLLIKAAIDYDPQEAKGVDGTLRTIAEQPYGKVLLLLAAAGLAAFGLFSFIEARYRRL